MKYCFVWSKSERSTLDTESGAVLNISLQLIQFSLNIFFCLCLVLSGLKCYVDATLIVNSGCVSVNFGLPDLSFHFMSEKNCSHKYVLLNIAHNGQTNSIIF
jgi:hypothetical protein